MAPIKFEEKIKDKLEQRSVSPSTDAWSKLAQRLDDDATSKQANIFWWIGIAAGIVIMLAITIQIFGNDTTEKVMPQVVEEPLKEDNTNALDITSKDRKSQIQLVNEPTTQRGSEEEPESIRTEAQKSLKANKPGYSANTQLALLENKSKGDKSKQDVNTKEIESTTAEISISKEGVAAVLKELNTSLEKDLDREVDSLLKLASKELFKNQLKKQATKTVDAKALLESVQEDMGQSFRTKIFEALKDSYKTVRTAVAERNN
jgi:hypothetical protein